MRSLGLPAPSLRVFSRATSPAPEPHAKVTPSLDEAAVALQAAWRARSARKAIGVLDVDGRRVAIDRRKLAAREPTTPLLQGLNAQAPVRLDLGLKDDALGLMLGFLEGDELICAPAVARELARVAVDLDMPVLAARCAEILQSHVEEPVGFAAGLFDQAAGLAGVHGLRLLDARRLQNLERLGFARGFVDTSVGRVHHISTPGIGTGPPLVVIHGLLGSVAKAEQLLPLLKPHASRIIAVDLPGHGWSDVPRAGMRGEQLRAGLFEALDQLVPDGCTLYGNSLGGLSVVRYALARPDVVQALCLSSPAGTPMTPIERERLFDKWRATTKKRAAENLSLLPRMNSWLKPMLPAAIRAKCADPGLQELLGSASTTDFVRARELRSLEMPLLLIWGTDDNVLPRSQRDFYVRNVPAHAVVVEPEGMRHTPNAEQPREVADLIGDFLQRLEHARALPFHGVDDDEVG